MRSGLRNRLAIGVVLAASLITATRIIRAEPPQAVGTWASLGSTPDSRIGAATVALKDGRMLVAGGSVNGTPTDSVVVFDPNDGSFTTAGHLLLARVGHTATLLDDDRVLIAGGTSGDLTSADLELFDPAAGVSVLAGAMTQPRTGHAAAKLANGAVLIVGGTGTDGVLQNAEVYDPQTGATAPTALPMLAPRTGATATTLIDGRVLIAGGNNGTADLASAELFEASSQIFEQTTTSLSVPRSGHAAVLLPNNNSVLIAGGSSNGVAQASSELFVPAEFPDPYSYGMGSFAPTGSLITARSGAIASPHVEGYAVAMGGGAPEAEVYRFATIKTDKDDYAPGTKAIITGSGWEPNADVTLVFQEDPAVHDDYILHVTPDANGDIRWDQWAPEEHDLNVRFYLLAKQAVVAGERRAQTTFTDSRNWSLTFAGTGAGSVTITPSTGTVNAPVSCGGSGTNAASQTVTSTCSPNISTSDNGATVTLSASSAVGSAFAGWSGATNLSSSTCTGTTNPCSAVFGSPATLTVTFNAAPPTVTSINRSSTSPTNASSVAWAVSFSNNVTGVDASDFTFSTTGLTGSPSITGVTGSGSNYTVTATTANGTGTLGLNLVDNDSITDTAGNKLGGTGAGNGNFTGQTYSIDRTLTPTVTASNKVYDGTTAATVTSRNFTSALTVTEAVTVTGGSATFANKSVGTGKTVTVTGLSLTGANAAKYVLSSTSATTTADITAKDVTIAGAVGNNKTYDGTTSATVNFGGASLVGVVGGDVVTINPGSYSASFATKTAGNGKTITVTGVTVGGTDAPNYTVSQPAGLTADITPKHITGTFTASDKIYDGTAAAVVVTRSVTGAIGGDDINLTGGTATFADKNVGTAKTVTLAGASLTGADAANYALDSVATTTADITVKHITGSFTVSNTVYDGTTTATVLTRNVSGAVVGDDVSLTGGTATFSDRNVGTAKTVTLSGASLAGVDAGNYVLDSVATTTADITALHITGTFTAQNKTYDGTTAATVLTRGLTGAISGDSVSLVGGTASFADKNFGTAKTVTLSGASLTGADAGNYLLDSVSTTTANITALHITGSFTAHNKTYDGTTAATVHTSSLATVIAGDDVALDGGTATFADKHVGTNKTVTLTGSALAGADAGNYVLDSVSTTTADITAKHITGTFTASNKIYDGTTAATVLTRSLDGAIGGDAVNLTGGVASFADKNVGTGKTVSLTGASLDGANASDYALDSVSTTTADIMALHITGTFTASNKVYDGTAAATALTRSLVGAIGADAVSLAGGTATFADKNVGAGKTVTLTGASLDGADAGNYLLDSVSTATADITPLHITGAFTASNKTYDGTTAATVLTRSLVGAIGSDTVSLSGGTATFADKNVGTAKVITLTAASLAGADAGNYALDSVATTTADISALHIIGIFTAASKVYDGTPSATVLTRALSGAVVSDDVSLHGGSASFADKNAGPAKIVTLSGAGLTGADAGNYVLDSVATATADITALHITGNFTASNKTYDGATAATVLTRSLAGAFTSDDVSLDGGTATFADKNAGTGKTVTLTGASLTGVDAANYVLDSVSTTTADITALHITGTFTADSKVYDGTTAATVATRSLIGAIGGDGVSLTGGTATFANRNVGINKTVTLAGASLTGADAGNYVLDSVATTTADITALHITGTFTAASKVYDGTTTAAVLTRNLSGALMSDAVSLTGGTASFSDKHVGTGKTVTLSGASLGGADAGDYVLDSVSTATADITALPVTGSFTADNKIYDGATAASVLTRSLAGALISDDVSLDGGSATFADKHIGIGKTVTLTGAWLAGTDAGDYVLGSVSTTTANIAVKHITGTFTAGNRSYDGTTAATVLTRSLVGAVSGDAISLSGGTAAFANKDVGTGKIVTLTGAALAGADAGDYVLDAVSTTTADITSLHITGIFTASNKVYDATTAATVVTRSLVDAIGGDSVSLAGGTATFADKNVGTGKTVMLAGASLSGTDSGNYALDSVATTTADITPKHITGTFTASDKTYDTTTTATVVSRNVTGAIVGDTVNHVGGNANFNTKNVGVGKTVTLTGATLNGGDAGNYLLDSIAGTTANITQKTLTVAGITANNKPYDGTTTATLNVGGAALVGVLSPDAVTLNVGGATGTFASSGVGSWPVQISGLTLSGADSPNYSLTQPATTASIGAWTLSGFYQPVTMGEWIINTVKGGSTVPLKFNVYQGTSERTDVAAVKPFVVQQAPCSAGTVQGDVDFVTTGGTTLRYDATGRQFIQNWQTPKTPGSCYRVTMETVDGSQIYAYFKMK